MVSVINLISGIKEPTHGYQNWNSSGILIFGGYVKVRETLYTQFFFLGQYHPKLY